MDKIDQLDSTYEQFIKNLNDLCPDGVIEVDLELLNKMGILADDLDAPSNSPLTRFFHVVESKEKITLFNEQFTIWVVPDSIDEEPITLVLVAHSSETNPKLELAFTTSGIYNSSRLVLRVLENFLAEIQENEEVINKLQEQDQNEQDQKEQDQT